MAQVISIATLTGPELLKAFNAVTGGKVKKFSSKNDGVKRLIKALAERNADLVFDGGQYGYAPKERLAEKVTTPVNRTGKANGSQPPPIPKKFLRSAESDEKRAERKAKREKAQKADAAKTNATDKAIFAKAKAKTTKAANKGPSQSEIIVDLISRPDGVTVEELSEKSGASIKNVRWYMSQHVKKKLGMTITKDGDIYKAAPA